MKSPPPTMHDDLRADLAALRELVADVLWEIDNTVGFDDTRRAQARQFAMAGRDAFDMLAAFVGDPRDVPRKEYDRLPFGVRKRSKP